MSSVCVCVCGGGGGGGQKQREREVNNSLVTKSGDNTDTYDSIGHCKYEFV